MKYLIIAFAAILLAGCNDSKQFMPKSIPNGLKDCKFYELTIDGRDAIVVRCPLSETSAAFRQGKVMRYTASN